MVDDPSTTAPSQSEYTARWSAARKADLLVAPDGVLVHPTAPHGTAGGYANYGCRCTACSSAKAESNARFRRRRINQRVEVDGRLVAVLARKHGAAATYTNYGCRCIPCTEAWRVK